MAQLGISAKFEIEDWDPDFKAYAEFLATDKTLQGVVQTVAADVVKTARVNIGGARVNTKVKPKQEKVLGHYWVTSPYAIQQEIRVKSGEGDIRRRKRRYPIYVVLAVADHPYSMLAERGGRGFKGKYYMWHAGRRIANRSSSIVFRRRGTDS